MKHVEQNYVAGERRNRSLDILRAKVDVIIARCGNATSLFDFPRIDIESEDRLPATAFAQIKREQTKSTADIQDRLVRLMKQFVGGAMNGIATQFVSHITTEPALRKLGGDAGAS